MNNRKILRVIVLGAGASCSYCESPTGLRPPLAREIIPTFHKLDISTNRYVLVGHIINYVRDTRGILPHEFASWDEDLETFFSEIDEEVAKYAERIKGEEKLDSKTFYKYSLAVGAYNQLIFLFASIFNEIQNGPISIPYMLLASELNQNDVVITFNWDTLLDRALAASGKWSPSNGYCIRPEAVFDDEWKSPDDLDDVDNSPVYIKLHGSTNWLSPYHSIDLSSGGKYTMSKYGISKLFVFVKATKPYETYEDRYWGSYEPYSYCYYPPNLPIIRDDIEEGRVGIRIVSAIDLPSHGKCVIGGKGVFSMPLIVPPVRNKQYTRYGKIFSTLWSLAKHSIGRCKHLFIIGYSFPRTDIAARQMFKEGLQNNTSLEKITIINPYPENIEEMFLNEFNIAPPKLEIRKEKFEVPYGHQGSIL